MHIRSRQRGISLIEVLVAVVVFSVGVMGLALMQAKGAQATKQAGSRGYAVAQVRSLMDAMRGNNAAAALPRTAVDPANPTSAECPYCFDGKTAPTVTDCSSATCTAQQMAANDLAEWLDRLRAAAPGPVSGVMANVVWNGSLGMYTITARWYGGAMDGSAPQAGDDLTYTLNYLPPQN